MSNMSKQQQLPLEPKIRIDMREKGNVVSSELEKMLIPIRYEMLDVGDYIIGDVCVERKEAGDYIASLVDGRLNNQLYQMSYNYPISILLIEGSIENAVMGTNIKRQQYISSLVGTIIKRAPDGEQGIINLLNVTTSFDTALFIKKILDKQEQYEPRLPRYNVSKKISKEDRSLVIFKSLPGVGDIKAKLLVEKFKTFQALTNATLEEIDSVKGIGLNMAKDIWEVLH